MKKNLLRFAAALFFSTLFYVLFGVCAEGVKDSKYSVATAVELQKFLTAQSTSVSQDCDINSDGKINAIDMTLLKRYLIYGEPGSDTTTTTTIITDTTTVTTTTSISTPTTTTKVGYGLIQQAIEEVSVTDTTIPKYKGEYCEATDAVFLCNIEGTTYAYTLLAEKPTNSLAMLTNINLIKGLHVWLYNGSEVPVSIDDALPNTDGLTFTANDPSAPNQEFTYELKPYFQIFTSDITSVAKKIASNGTQYGFNIANYDYNLSGKLEYEDVKIMVQYFTSELHNMFWRLNDGCFWRYTYYLPTLGHTNVAFIKTEETKPVTWAINIPTKDFCPDIPYASATVPVQILPGSMIDELADYPENTEMSDSTCDYIAWLPTENTWAKVAKDSEEWWFQGGFYVFLLDDDGNYRKEWNRP